MSVSSTERAQMEEIFVLLDILSVGPVKGLHTIEGIQARFQWLNNRCKDKINERDAYMHGMTEPFKGSTLFHLIKI